MYVKRSNGRRTVMAEQAEATAETAVRTSPVLDFLLQTFNLLN